MKKVIKLKEGKLGNLTRQKPNGKGKHSISIKRMVTSVLSNKVIIN